MIRGVGNMDEPTGVRPGLATFLSSLTKNTDEDKAVYCSANDTVALVTAGVNFFGVVRTLQSDGLAGVQRNGYAELEYTGSNPSVGWAYLVGGATAGKVALADEGAIKTVSITVATGGKTGSSAADPDLVGGIEIGVVSDTNQDQLVDNVAIGADGAVTVTLAANATADNKFDVAVLKAQAMWPNRYHIRSVDTTAKTIVIDL